MYAALRDHDPVHHVVPRENPAHDYWVLSRHADVWHAARDHETFSSAQGLTVTYGELELIGLQDNPPMVMQDPPVHTEFRKLVARGFTPRQVEAVEPAVRAFVAERLERLLAAGGGDIVAELFKPLPSMVVAHYLGVPEEDRAQFDGWTEAIVAANTTSGGITGAAVGDAVTSMMGYFTQLIERRRREPGDDTVSHLVAAGVGADGDIAGTLSVLAFTFTMVTGGNDTTTGMLGGSVPLLHRRPDQRGLLAEHPELISAAVDELLRLTSPVQGLARTPTRDVTLHRTTIPAGRKVLLLYGSANRDERQYGPDADELDVTRRPRNILTFSHGAHHCLGAAAARMQSRVALTELLARCPDFEVDESGIVWSDGSYVRRPLSVPIRVAIPDAGDWLAARRAEVAADRILDAAEQLCAEGPAPVGMNEIARAAGCSPGHAVPLLREPGGAADRVRAPRDASLRPRDYGADRRHRRPARTAGRERHRHVADGARQPRAGVVVHHHPAADRRRGGRTVRGDHRPGRRVSERLGPKIPPPSNGAPAGWCGCSPRC